MLIALKWMGLVSVEGTPLQNEKMEKKVNLDHSSVPVPSQSKGTISDSWWAQRWPWEPATGGLGPPPSIAWDHHREEWEAGGKAARSTRGAVTAAGPLKLPSSILSLFPGF